MAQRDASLVQLDFPELTAELIAALRLTGTLGLLELSDIVTPVFLIGSRGIVFGAEAPVFQSAGVFSGSVNTPAANTVIADTGQLAAGDFDIQASFSHTGSQPANTAPMRLEHRDAANAVTLATLLQMDHGNFAASITMILPLMGYRINLNERFRVLSPGGAASGRVSGTIMTQIRPTP